MKHLNAPQVPNEDERRLTLISVMIVFLLAAMSQTVIATAMPRIVGDLSGLHLYSWATTAYLLASTVMVPIWGKLGDLFGRKAVLLSGIGLFLLGSWLAGLSGEFGDLPLIGGGMTQLITFRAIQGTGGGALFTTAFAILADLFAPRERAKFSGLFGSIFGISSIFGPVVGGFLTDHGTMTILGHHVAGWRWVFFFNVPFATAAVAMIIWKMPPMAPKGAGGIDWFGSGLIIATFVPLLLAITWGGREHAWGSPLILSMLAWSLAGLAAFIFIEGKVREPILPLEMFRNRTFVTANGAGFVYSMAFMGVSSFLPLYMQVGLGYPATKSGLTMLSLMGGFVFSSTITGQLVTRTGHFKPFMLGGGAILVVGITLLCFIGPDTSTLDLAWRLLIFGIGLGPGQSLFSLAVQNDTPPHRMGVATSSSQFVRQIGSTMGVALFGALLTASLANELADHARANPGAQVRQLDMGDLQKMAVERSLHPEAAAARLADPKAQAEERMIRESFSVAIVHGLMFSLAVLVIGFVLMVMVPAAPLRERHPPPEPEPAVGPAEPPPTNAQVKAAE